MKKAIVALVLACLITVILAAPVMAYGNDPSVQPGPSTPNEVDVPQKAFEARGQMGNPPNPDSHGAIFHQTYVPGQG